MRRDRLGDGDHALWIAHQDVTGRDQYPGALYRDVQVRDDMGLAKARRMHAAREQRQPHLLHGRQVADGAIGDHGDTATGYETRREHVA